MSTWTCVISISW